ATPSFSTAQLPSVARKRNVAASTEPPLERGVEYLLAELEKNPPREVVAPPAPSDFGGGR
ncbi:MAG: hypothetical protein AAFX58_13840, partial [Pseudomonadota bacterium]